MDLSIIDRYEHGRGYLRQAIADLTFREWLAVPVPGKWSVHQVVMHLLDSDLVITERMKRIIAEDKPVLLAFDQDKWLANLHYEAQDTAFAAGMFEANRMMFTRVLRRLPESAFDRVGVHTERGPQTLRDVLTFAAGHLDHHMGFISEKRAALIAARACDKG